MLILAFGMSAYFTLRKCLDVKQSERAISVVKSQIIGRRLFIYIKVDLSPEPAYGVSYSNKKYPFLYFTFFETGLLSIGYYPAPFFPLEIFKGPWEISAGLFDDYPGEIFVVEKHDKALMLHKPGSGLQFLIENVKFDEQKKTIEFSLTPKDTPIFPRK